MTLHCERATPADAHAIYALEQAIFPEDPWTQGMIDQELSAPNRYYVIAYAQADATQAEEHATRTPVGYCGISLGPDADVMTIGVVHTMRGRGIGETLMADALDYARTHGVERIFLEVRESNHGAQRLYEKLGFSAVGRVRGYFRNPTEDAITMRHIVLSEIDVS